MSRRWRPPIVKDVLPIENGVFSHMEYTFRAEVTKEQLDFLFMTSYSRKNLAPVIDILHDSDADEDEFSQLTDAELTKLANLMLSYYKPRWDKLAEIYDIEYDPIHNYLDDWEDENDGRFDSENGKEVEQVDTLNTTVTKSNTRTDNLTEIIDRDVEDDNTRTDNLTERTQYGKTSTETRNTTDTVNYGKVDEREDDTTRNNTGTVQDVGNRTDTSSVWGFNSGTDVNSDKNTGSNSNTRTDNLVERKTGTVTDTLSGSDVTLGTGTVADALSGSDTVSNSGTRQDARDISEDITKTNSGTQTDAGSDATTGTNRRVVTDEGSRNDTDHRERSGRHFGNIGNLTSQKMIKEEIELWKWSYIQSILEDARDFLTLSVYLD